MDPTSKIPECENTGTLQRVIFINKTSTIYKIDIIGNVLNTKSGRILKPGNVQGYLQIGLRINGIILRKYIHRLVAETFIPNPNNLPEINHKDNNRKNNRVDNLEWVTAQQNTNHKVNQNRHFIPYGESCGMSILKEQDVLEIRALFINGTKQADLARKYKVSPQVIWYIIKRKTWKHI